MGDESKGGQFLRFSLFPSEDPLQSTSFLLSRATKLKVESGDSLPRKQGVLRTHITCNE